MTYADLQREVNQAANALESLGSTKGDRVAIYLPMVPEAAIAMLARAGSVRCTGRRSVASAEACARASRMPRRRWSSPPTAVTGAGHPAG